MLVLHSDLIERSQPMEEAQLEDPTSMKFTWKIDNFTTLKSWNVYSDIFTFGGYKWRILICPKGNNNVGWFSMYLNVAGSETLPYGWSRYAQFSLAIVNQIHNKDSIRKDTQHQFNTRETDFGFTSFMPLVELHDPDRGYVVNDTIFIEAEIRLKKEEEVDHHTIIKVSRDVDLEKQIGRDIYFDLVDHEKVCSFRIKKQTPFLLFKEEVAKEFGIPVQFQRFWFWAVRENQTYRPCRPLTPQEESKSVEKLEGLPYKAHKNSELKLFLEVEFGPDQRPIPLPEKTKEDILLFFKLYEPEKRELRFVGRFLVKSFSKPVEILSKLNQLAGFAPEEEIELYEEIRFDPFIMCEHIHKWTSFCQSQIGDGDIICFQKSAPLQSDVECKYADVPSFLDYVHNRQIDTVRYLENAKEEDSSTVNQDSDQHNPTPMSTALIPATMDTSQPQEQAKETVLPGARVDEIPALTMSLPTTWTSPEPTPPGEAAQVTLESMATDFGHATASGEIETQNDAPQVPVLSVQDVAGSSSPKDDEVTLRRLSAAEELLKSTSASEPSAEALAALNTVTRCASTSLTSLCKDGAYEEFKAALKLLTEQGMIPSRITSMLKDLLASLEGEMPKFVAAETEFFQGGEVFAAQHEEMKAQMELAMQKCKERKDIVSNYDAKVEELEAELARVKAERSEAMESLKTAVDEMEPLKQSFADSSSKSENFIVRHATLTLQTCGPVGTWVVVQDVLKKYFKF